MSLKTFFSQVRSRFVVQPDSVTCQAACICKAINSDDVHGIRKRLLTIGNPGNPHVMSQVLHEELGSKRYQFLDNASLEDAKELLEQGCLLITHGWFTPSGHVIVIDGVEIDLTTLSYRFRVKDPWSEFNAPAWLYNLGSHGFHGFYSSRLIYAACVVSQSVSDAFAIYRRRQMNSDLKGMWLHVIYP